MKSWVSFAHGGFSVRKFIIHGDSSSLHQKTQSKAGTTKSAKLQKLEKLIKTEGNNFTTLGKKLLLCRVWKRWRLFLFTH
jgi:hypothetical protein